MLAARPANQSCSTPPHSATPSSTSTTIPAINSPYSTEFCPLSSTPHPARASTTACARRRTIRRSRRISSSICTTPSRHSLVASASPHSAYVARVSHQANSAPVHSLAGLLGRSLILRASFTHPPPQPALKTTRLPPPVTNVAPRRAFYLDEKYVVRLTHTLAHQL